MFLTGYVVLSFYFWSYNVWTPFASKSIVFEQIHLLSEFEGDYHRRVQRC